MSRDIHMDSERASNHLIVFFDGDCLVCNKTVQFLLDKDRSRQLLFCRLKSERALSLLGELGNTTETMVALDEGVPYIRSSAVIRICLRLPYPWRFGCTLAIVPTVLRDWMYKQFAKKRLAFGSAQVCPIPSKEMRSRFID